ANGHVLYGVLGLVGSYLGIYFYLRVIQYMFMSGGAPAAKDGAAGRLTLGASILCLLIVIAISVFPGWVIDQL
ncbi:MAG: NADH-quinone oxidoreductase subunit N, partial [Casimicrobiaceae bacterium]